MSNEQEDFTVTTRKIQEESEIISVINSFDRSFPRPLSSRVENLSEYAKKLAKNAIFIVAEDNFNVIGFTAMYANDSISGQAYLAQIAVSKEYLGQKIGNLLLSLCEKTARENGMKTMKLEVDKINERAIEFYKKDGFLTESANDLSFFMVKNL